MIGKNGTTTSIEDVKDRLTDGIDQAAEALNAESAELARELRQKADEARKAMIRTLNDSALNLRQGTRDAGAPNEVIGAVDDVAKGFERAASYLNTHTVDEIRQDAEQTIRQNSTLIIVVAVIIGLIVGLLLRGGSKK